MADVAEFGSETLTGNVGSDSDCGDLADNNFRDCNSDSDNVCTIKNRKMSLQFLRCRHKLKANRTM